MRSALDIRNRPRQTFAEHVRNSPPAPPPPTAPETPYGGLMRAQQEAAAEQERLHPRRADARRVLPVPPAIVRSPATPRQIANAERVRLFNEGGNLLDITVGADPGPGRTPGRGVAERVVNMPDGGGIFQRPSPGLIVWGVDTRRPLDQVVADVERATGAPTGYLSRLGIRESRGGKNTNPGTSSARGVFQVTQGTFRGWVVGDGPHATRFRAEYGIPETMTANELSNYWGDTRVDGAIAAEIARASDAWYRANGMQSVSEGDLYMAHFGDESGRAIALDRSRGAYRHRLGHQYFSAQEVNANETIFFKPLTDSAGRQVYRTVTSRGEAVRVPVGDRRHPRTPAEVYERLASHFPSGNVEFDSRSNGNREPIG